MKNFLNENFKYIILTFVIILIGLIIYDMTKVDNGMSKEDKKQIEQLNKDIDSMINYQKKLDEKMYEFPSFANNFKRCGKEFKDNPVYFKHRYN